MDQKDRLAEDSNADKHADGRNDTGKKPYHKPSFRHEKVFETMALSCGKVSRLQKSCQFRRMSS